MLTLSNASTRYSVSVDRSEFRFKCAPEILNMIGDMLKIPPAERSRLLVRFNVSHKVNEELDFYEEVARFKKEALRVTGTMRFAFSLPTSYHSGRVS